jgi:hypothetical protein
MGRKRQIPALPVVEDIRAGMTNAQLMKRYQISSGMLEKVFKKLQDANMITARDLDGRMLSLQQGVVGDSVREEPRCYTIMRLPITDLDNLDADCYVKALTEKGLHIINLSTTVGEKKNFLIPASDFADVQPFSFEAECRWTRAQTDTARQAAGFEITRISDEGLQQLRDFMQSATICE